MLWIFFILWTFFIQIVLKSFVAYLLIQTGWKISEISDALVPVPTYAMAIAMAPFIPWAALKSHFRPIWIGMISGLVIASSWMLLLSFFELYRWVGLFADPPIFKVLLHGACLWIGFFGGAYLLSIRCQHTGLKGILWGTLTSVALLSLLYPLSHLQRFTWLFLVGWILLQNSLKPEQMWASCSRFASFLVVLHHGLSVPILGLNQQGLIYLQYAVEKELETPSLRFLTGGVGGLLSGILLPTIFSILILRDWKALTYHFRHGKHVA